jgi:two-component system, NtrC family, response regulator AtoC
LKFADTRELPTGSRTASQPIRILLIDSDLIQARQLASQLSRRQYETTTAATTNEAIRGIRLSVPKLILIDAGMLDSAPTALESLRRASPESSIVVISGDTRPDQVFRLSKMGADEFLAKPVDLTDLDARIGKLITGRNATPPRTQRPDFAMMFGASAKMEDVKVTIEKVADTNATVLIRGESGTGKEMAARMIYGQSGRRERPFVKVNCAAIPYELLESELFGYEQGAFTGANKQKLGKFDQANNGTIFLDEISEMHPSLQAKLLHVLQDGEFARLGGKRDIAVDVRVLAATNKPLERAVSQGSFREDLFYRLNVVTIHIPPLRERREEIPVFLDFFLSKYSEQYNKQPEPFSDFAIQRLMEYDWPGNIRELENLVKRYTIVGNEAQIMRELATHKPIVSSSAPLDDEGSRRLDPQPEPGSRLPMRPADMSSDAPSLLDIGRRAAYAAEREAIQRVLLQTKWNRRQAAKILKISYKALLNKLKLMEEEQERNKNEQHPT